MPVRFPELLRAYRAEIRLTQEELAVRAGLSPHAISSYERGERHPRPATILALADALSLSPDKRDALTASLRPPSALIEVADASTFLPPPTPLIGRSHEMDRLRRLFADQATRLVTVTGPPGVGKTRLAQELHGDVRQGEEGPFALWLAPLKDAGLVPSAICQALGLREHDRQRPVETIVNGCQSRRLMMILDNFEHLMDAAPLLAELLSRCQGLRMLVTSRASLHIRGEHEFPLDPLPLPAGDGSMYRLETLGRVPSVTLFLERARAAAPDFELSGLNARTVAAVCRRLDGLPLALELAAPWVKLLTPDGLLEQLRQAGLFMEGPRDLPERQRTMKATLAWSCALLREEERALFRRLSVFVGSAPMDAVGAVCQAAGALPASVVRLLGVLSDQHLIRRETVLHEQPRISMLETIREHGLMLLREADETAVTRRAHAEYVAALTASAETQLKGPEQAACIRRLAAELDNVRAALAWADERREIEMGLQMAARLSTFWMARGEVEEGLQWLERLLAHAEGVRPQVHAAALLAAGELASRADIELGRRRHGEALALFRELGDRRGVAAALHGLAIGRLWETDLREAERLLHEAIAVFREIEDRQGTALSLSALGVVMAELGDDERASALYEESRAIYARLGNRMGVGRCLLNLGVSARRMGDLERAATSLDEAVWVARELDAPELLGSALVNLGNVPRSRGDAVTAHAIYAESLSILLQTGDMPWIAYALECLAWLAWSEGKPRRGARLYGAVDALRERHALPGWPVTSTEHLEAVGALREELGEAAFSADFEDGRSLSTTQAAAVAIDQLE